MPTPLNAQFPRRLAGAILITATMALTGCAMMRPGAEAKDSFMPDWADAQRTPAAASEASGLSDTSRQIERNLGFQ